MKLNAQGDWIVVRRTAATQTESGILLASGVKKVEHGEVIDAGGDAWNVSEGDIVVYRNGQEFDHGGEKLYAVEQKDVIAKVSP